MLSGGRQTWQGSKSNRISLLSCWETFLSCPAQVLAIQGESFPIRTEKEFALQGQRVEAPECRCLWFWNQWETRAIVDELLSLPLLRGWRRACRGEEEESTWWEEHLGRPVLPSRGEDNQADYFTKHHPTIHHRRQRPYFVQDSFKILENKINMLYTNRHHNTERVC